MKGILRLSRPCVSINHGWIYVYLACLSFREDDKATHLYEAERKLSYVRNQLWWYVAKELDGQPEYKFIRAYTAGENKGFFYL